MTIDVKDAAGVTRTIKTPDETTAEIITAIQADSAPAANFLNQNLPDVTSAATFTVFAAPATGNDNFVTDISLSNIGTADSMITLTDDADSSIVWEGIVPFGSGNNPRIVTPKKVDGALICTVLTANATIRGQIGGYSAGE